MCVSNALYPLCLSLSCQSIPPSKTLVIIILMVLLLLLLLSFILFVFLPFFRIKANEINHVLGLIIISACLLCVCTNRISQHKNTFKSESLIAMILFRLRFNKLKERLHIVQCTFIKWNVFFWLCE